MTGRGGGTFPPWAEPATGEGQFYNLHLRLHAQLFTNYIFKNSILFNNFYFMLKKIVIPKNWGL